MTSSGMRCGMAHRPWSSVWMTTKFGRRATSHLPVEFDSRGEQGRGLADADDEAYRLHREFRGSESLVEAKKARLRWCQAVADALRSEVSTERAERQLYADHGSDA